MTACEIQRDCLRSFSRFAGVRFLPPAVMMMSFLRPVIVEEAVLVERAEVAGVQPAVDDRAERRVVVPVVAAEDVRAADQDLAVVGDPDLDAGQRPADRAEAVVVDASRRSATVEVSVIP